jgi:glucosamine 6-phosphate synthetase-like amidotransferase/phosphosugar isomerase protein
MTYTTYFLKFASQKEAETKLEEVNYRHTETFDGEERTYYAVRDQVGDVDIVGDIYNNDGVYDEETLEVITPPTKKEGYHVNIILQAGLPDELKPFVVTPNNPYRVFA